MPPRNASGSKRPPQAAQSTAASSSNSSNAGERWNTIRPWNPPQGAAASSSAPITSTSSDRRAGPRGKNGGKLRLEVLDVSSTAVSIAIFPVLPTSTDAVGLSRAISVKLNGQFWPHVVHSDNSLWRDADFPGADDQAATIILYSLEPGQEYEVELDIVDEQQNEETHQEAEPEIAPERPAQTSSQPVAPTEDNAPNDPPPPYSSLDLSSPGPSASVELPMDTPNDSVLLEQEQSAKENLQRLREQAKTAENALRAPLNALKRNMDKAQKEEQRTRQRISTLEEATRKIKQDTAEHLVEADAIQAEEVDPLSEELDGLTRTAAESRARFNAVDKQSKQLAESRDDSLKALEKEITDLTKQELELNAERAHYENEVVPQLLKQLNALDEEVQRIQRASVQNSQYSNYSQTHNSPTSNTTYPMPPPGLSSTNSAPPGLHSFQLQSETSRSPSEPVSRANSLRVQTPPNRALTAGQSRVIDHAHAAQQHALEMYFGNSSASAPGKLASAGGVIGANRPRRTSSPMLNEDTTPPKSTSPEISRPPVQGVSIIQRSSIKR